MGRRRFLRDGLALAWLGVLAACGPVAAPGRPLAGPRRVGYLEVNPGESAAVRGQTEAFRAGLREHGYAEGRANLTAGIAALPRHPRATADATGW